jgi:hypothetical protein
MSSEDYKKKKIEIYKTNYSKRPKIYWRNV